MPDELTASIQEREAEIRRIKVANARLREFVKGKHPSRTPTEQELIDLGYRPKEAAGIRNAADMNRITTHLSNGEIYPSVHLPGSVLRNLNTKLKRDKKRQEEAMATGSGSGAGTAQTSPEPEPTSAPDNLPPMDEYRGFIIQRAREGNWWKVLEPSGAESPSSPGRVVTVTPTRREARGEVDRRHLEGYSMPAATPETTNLEASPQPAVPSGPTLLQATDDQPKTRFTGNEVLYRGANIREELVTLPQPDGEQQNRYWITEKNGEVGRFGAVEDAQRWLRMRKDRLQPTGNSPQEASAQAETGPTEPPSTLRGGQVTLGNDFATNRSREMPMASQDFGDKGPPLTTPPVKLDPDQTHFLPDAPGDALAAPEPRPLPPAPPAEDVLFAAPMTKEQSRRAGSGLETDAETGRPLTATERWEIDASRPAPALDAAIQPPVATIEASAAAQSERVTQRLERDQDCPLPDGDACIAILKPDELQTDAKLFQYKSDTDEQGVSVKLADVKTWDSDLAGVAYVWERADGQRYIVDGHQRLALAQRLRAEGQDPELLVKIWREADGYTPRIMRLSAAKKNIAEGSGTAVDAARVLREEPGLFDTLSQRNSIVRDAQGLARLDPEVFQETVEHVNAGHLPENVASLIADAGADPALQRGTLQEFVREQRQGHITRPAAENLLYVIRRNQLDEVEAKAQGTLSGFDVGAVRGSAWRERAALQQGLVNAFRNDRRLFGEVVRGDSRLESVGNVLAEDSNESELNAARTNIEIFDRLANKKGPLADHLDAEAARIKRQMDETGASRQAAANAVVKDSARYLRPFLKTYIKDGGAALAEHASAKAAGPSPSHPRSQLDRPRITSSDITNGGPATKPEPDSGPPARQPITVQAVKGAVAATAKPTTTLRKHIKALPVKDCPAPTRSPRRSKQRAKERSKERTAAPQRRRNAGSDFTPAEIRRFERSIGRRR